MKYYAMLFVSVMFLAIPAMADTPENLRPKFDPERFEASMEQFITTKAGLTPQEAAEWQYKTTVGVAEALSKSNVRWVPEIMMNGNNSGSGSAMDAVGLNMLMDVAKKMKKE